MFFRRPAVISSASHLIGMYFVSPKSNVLFGIYTAASCALVAHKVVVILLHRPLGTLSLILHVPFLFAFDLVVLALLYYAFASVKKSFRIIGVLISVLIISSSAMFISSYLETNTAINWGRSVEIVSNWKTYGKIIMQGGGSTFISVVALMSIGCFMMVIRIYLYESKYQRLPVVRETLDPPCSPFRSPKNGPVVHLVILFIGSLLVRSQPWRQMTSTLVVDIVFGISAVLLPKLLISGSQLNTSDSATGIFSSLNYNPAFDPYYISNLDTPIDPFIAEAVDGIKFTNIVHIVLESMRVDAFPFKETSPFTDYIRENFPPRVNGTPITTSHITPFIASLAEHTISWETMWSIVPFTHKALLGRRATNLVVLTVDYCGAVGLPIDWTVEMVPPAKPYQHCLPDVLRQISSITSIRQEVVDTMNSTPHACTDLWEPVHITTADGAYDYERKLFESFGFTAFIGAEDLKELLPSHPEFDYPLGYYDDKMTEYFWRYVDHTIQRQPRNRMYLSWMSTTTHTPFLFEQDWLEGHYQPFLQDDDYWGSTDKWLNAVRFTDDKVKEIILGFRQRGLENETLFIIHADHGFPFIADWKTPVENVHNEPFQIPWMIYNPLIKNPTKQRVQGSFYSLSLPTTILDLLVHTKSLAQSAQRELADRFARNYEFAQSLLRPVKDALRIFLVSPGGTQWAVDNSKNLRCTFHLKDDYVHLVDFITDPLERNRLSSWQGVEGLIAQGAEDIFGPGTEEFLRDAHKKQDFMKTELLRRYGLQT